MLTLSEEAENQPPIFEQTGEHLHAGRVYKIPGNIVDLNDSKYQLSKPLKATLEKHPDHYEVEETETKRYGNGITQEEALTALREIVVLYREDLRDTPDNQLGTDLKGHKRFWEETLVLKTSDQTE